MVSKRILHDLKRIAKMMGLLQDEIDRLYEDLSNNNRKKKEVKKND